MSFSTARPLIPNLLIDADLGKSAERVKVLLRVTFVLAQLAQKVCERRPKSAGHDAINDCEEFLRWGFQQAICIAFQYHVGNDPGMEPDRMVYSRLRLHSTRLRRVRVTRGSACDGRRAGDLFERIACRGAWTQGEGFYHFQASEAAVDSAPGSGRSRRRSIHCVAAAWHLRL
jgi:hypothetical protein